MTSNSEQAGKMSFAIVVTNPSNDGSEIIPPAGSSQSSKDSINQTAIMFLAFALFMIASFALISAIAYKGNRHGHDEHVGQHPLQSRVDANIDLDKANTNFPRLNVLLNGSGHGPAPAPGSVSLRQDSIAHPSPIAHRGGNRSGGRQGGARGSAVMGGDGLPVEGQLNGLGYHPKGNASQATLPRYEPPSPFPPAYVQK